MPFYQYHLFFCTNQREPNPAIPGEVRPCCAGKNAVALRDYAKSAMKKALRESPELQAKGAIRVNNAGCLDRCEQGPCLVIYPEGIWYTYWDEKDIDEIINSHIKQGKVVKRLLIDR